MEGHFERQQRHWWGGSLLSPQRACQAGELGLHSTWQSGLLPSATSLLCWSGSMWSMIAVSLKLAPETQRWLEIYRCAPTTQHMDSFRKPFLLGWQVVFFMRLQFGETQTVRWVTDVASIKTPSPLLTCGKVNKSWKNTLKGEGVKRLFSPKCKELH